MKSFCGKALPNIPDKQCSNIVYMSIVDLHADTLQAMEMVVSKLYKEYGIGTTPVQYIVLFGDQKTFSCVHELKQMYGSELDWLIPFIGAWLQISSQFF